MLTTDIINKQVFDFTCTNETIANEVHNSFVHYTTVDLNNIITEVLTEKQESKNLFIDKIEINLGNINIRDFGNDEMLIHFRNILKEKVSYFSAIDDNAIEKNKISSVSEAALQSTIAFLLTGDLPWWLDKALKVDLDKMLKQLIREKPQEIKKFLLNEGSSQSVVARLLTQFKPSTRLAVDHLVPGLLNESGQEKKFAEAEYEINIKELPEAFERVNLKLVKRRVGLDKEYKLSFVKKLLKQPFDKWEKELQILGILSESEFGKIQLIYSSNQSYKNKRKEVEDILKKLTAFQVQYLLKSASSINITKTEESENKGESNRFLEDEVSFKKTPFPIDRNDIVNEKEGSNKAEISTISTTKSDITKDRGNNAVIDLNSSFDDNKIGSDQNNNTLIESSKIPFSDLQKKEDKFSDNEEKAGEENSLEINKVALNQHQEEYKNSLSTLSYPNKKDVDNKESSNIEKASDDNKAHPNQLDRSFRNDVQNIQNRNQNKSFRSKDSNIKNTSSDSKADSNKDQEINEEAKSKNQQKNKEKNATASYLNNDITPYKSVNERDGKEETSAGHLSTRMLSADRAGGKATNDDSIDISKNRTELTTEKNRPFDDENTNAEIYTEDVLDKKNRSDKINKQNTTGDKNAEDDFESNVTMQSTDIEAENEVLLYNNLEIRKSDESRHRDENKRKSRINYIRNKLSKSNEVLNARLILLKEEDLNFLEARFKRFESHLLKQKEFLEKIINHPFLFKYDLFKMLQYSYFLRSESTAESKLISGENEKLNSSLTALFTSITSSQPSFLKTINSLPAMEKLVLQDVLKKKSYETESEKKILKKIFRKLSGTTIQLLRFFTELPEEEMNGFFAIIKNKTTTDIEAGSRNSPRYKDKELKFQIENAGLCVIATYFPALFSQLNYLENRIFKNRAAALRALYLIQYITTGEAKSFEYLLQFNKVLCGFETDDNLSTNIRLTKKEKTEADDLLQSVIDNWDMIKSTSVNGFRQSFLQRKGILTESDLSWTLQVERKGYDVLLSSIPWGFGIIKLPWMKKHIQVEW